MGVWIIFTKHAASLRILIIEIYTWASFKLCHQYTHKWPPNTKPLQLFLPVLILISKATLNTSITYIAFLLL
jgi:hypothetical protein